MQGVGIGGARSAVGLNDVQGWGWGVEVRGGLMGCCGGGGQTLRTALHSIGISLQNRRYPVFEDEKSNGSDEKSVKRKIALIKDRQY